MRGYGNPALHARLWKPRTPCGLMKYSFSLTSDHPLTLNLSFFCHLEQVPLLTTKMKKADSRIYFIMIYIIYIIKILVRQSNIPLIVFRQLLCVLNVNCITCCGKQILCFWTVSIYNLNVFVTRSYIGLLHLIIQSSVSSRLQVLRPGSYGNDPLLYYSNDHPSVYSNNHSPIHSNDHLPFYNDGHPPLYSSNHPQLYSNCPP